MQQIDLFDKKEVHFDQQAPVVVAKSQTNNANKDKVKEAPKPDPNKDAAFSNFDLEDEEPMKKGKVLRILESSQIQLFLLIVTFYSLFADDYRTLTSKQEMDIFYDVFVIICMAIFSIEIFISCFFKGGYFNSYYFYLDIISTASLILDFSPVRNALIEFSYSGNSGLSKLGKLIRLIRLFRLVRISKIYKSLSSRDNSETQQVVKKRKKTDSKVGRRLSELATKAVIIMCFMLLILLPLFNSDFWINPDTGPEGACFGYKNIMSYNWTTKADTKSLVYAQEDALFNDGNEKQMLAYTTKNFLDDFLSQSSGAMLKVKFPNTNVEYFKDANYSMYRLEEINVGLLDYQGGYIEVHQDGATWNTLDAILNIIRTFYICFILLGGSSLFANSTYKLIIEPIERMTEKVVAVIEKPQKVKEKAFIQSEESELKQTMNGGNVEEPENENNSMETVVVEDAIKKIGILLGVGLGEAGSSLISSYLRVRKDGKADGDALMKNVQELDAIFGFCDIRNFTDATEVLQQDVMVFVNTIADIVHTIADRNLGAANKNIGDAFLIVWKIPDGLEYHAQDSPFDDADRIEHNRRVFSNLADMALFAILKMYAEINRSHTLVKYVNNEGLRKRIGNNYKVRLGFGLHYGWAIEGAIGSYHKVDVSYLSPNVNMASWLEGNTKDYGVALLVSGEFYDLLTPPIKTFCRKVDAIASPGSTSPFRIYTPNMSDKAFEFPKQEPLKQHVLKTKECYTFKKLLKNEILAKKNVGPSVFENDIDIRLLTCHNNQQFIDYFNAAYLQFEKGDWALAKEKFEKGLAIQADDGPTKKLMLFMKEHNFIAPHDWEGFRNVSGGGAH